MTNGEALDRFLDGLRPNSILRLHGQHVRRVWQPRVQVRAVCAANGRAQGWSVQVVWVLERFEVAYFRSWTTAVRLAFDTAEYIRSKTATA